MSQKSQGKEGCLAGEVPEQRREMHLTWMALWGIIRKSVSEKMLSLATRLLSSKGESTVAPLSVGDNNSGNIYVFYGPVNITPTVPPSPTDPAPRLSIESN
jgi:hypothetical protein